MIYYNKTVQNTKIKANIPEHRHTRILYLFQDIPNSNNCPEIQIANYYVVWMRN